MLSTSLPNLSWKSDDEQKKRVQPFIIGVAGGTASGKTSVCYEVIKKLGIDIHRVALVSQDSFYKPLSKEEREHVHDYNFDHPDAFDWPLIEQTLIDLKAGKAAKIPVYDFVTHSRLPETTSICAIDIILFEGILVFYFPNITKMFDMKIFVDTDADTRLARRIVRDIRERGRELEGVLHQYQTFVKPSFEEYCSPTKKYADVIIPRGADNHVAIDLIVQHLRLKLGERRKNSKISKLHNVVKTPSKKNTESTENNNNNILASPPLQIKKHNDLDPLSLETHNTGGTQFEFDS